MSYQVLARKYRPQTFDEVVGQEHVTTTLKNAVEQNRLHHAYLLTGVRGTGKTSLARILAMALNCEDGPKVKFDPTSANCRAIAKGDFLDVLEIDGASNTSVENVRELREQVKYLPAVGKYRIYIIDEVHMLSTSAFNALLKTLEEPPPHVIFIFATTEVHKIPVTILSRCQRFDLRRLSQAQIRERLEFICKKEQVACNPQSLELLARAAEGSMRDGQSLLDMAIGLCGAKLRPKPIQDMLGLVEAAWIADLSRLCLKGKLRDALDQVQGLYERGYDLRQILVQWVDELHDLTLLKAVGSEPLRDRLTADQLNFMEETVAGIELSDLQVGFQTVYQSTEQIYRSDSPKILFDLLLIKLVHGNPFKSVGKLLATESDSQPFGSKSPSPLAGEGARRAGEGPRGVVRGREQRTENREQNTVTSEQKIVQRPDEILNQALKKFPQVKAILENALTQRWEGNKFLVVFEKGSLWEEMLKEKRAVLAEALSKALGQEVQVIVETGTRPVRAEVGAPPTLKSDDPLVQQAVDIFNATIQEIK